MTAADARSSPGAMMILTGRLEQLHRDSVVVHDDLLATATMLLRLVRHS
jgi:hypothetical protein